MFKRLFSPFLLVAALVGGLAVLEESNRKADESVVLSAAGPAPLCVGESRLSLVGKNAVADANRQGPTQED